MSIENDELVHNSRPDAPEPTDEQVYAQILKIWRKEYRHYNVLELYIEHADMYANQALLNALDSAFKANANGFISPDACKSIGEKIIAVTAEALWLRATQMATEEIEFEGD
jgi:hypothetical protein